MSLKQNPEAVWNGLLAVSLVAILTFAGLLFIQPKPRLSASGGSISSLRNAENETTRLEALAAEADAKIQNRTWDVSIELFGSQILDTLTRLADRNHLKLAGFTLGKPIAATTLQEAPCFVSIEGAFMDVMAMVKTLEQPESKIAVSQLKMIAGTGTDHVTASLALTGFLYKEAKKE
jgi:hypothetical protein